MLPAPARVIVAGGGPAATEMLLALRHLAGDRVALELLAPNPELVIRGYEVLAPFGEGHDHRYALSRVAADLGAKLIRDALASVQPAAQTLTLRSGAERRYDALVIAVGARNIGTLPGASAFRGGQDASRLRELLRHSQEGRHQSVAFVVPAGRTWPLPLYELALHTGAWLAERKVSGVPLTLISAERHPLDVFGAAVSAEVADLLGDHGVQFISGHALRFDSGRVVLSGGRELEADLAIALPRLGGPHLPGLPQDEDGYVPVDESGRVRAVERVFAAGDATTSAVKQGGLATQQADAIAELLAAELGAPVQVGAFRPVLRAVLFGGRERRYLYAELGEGLQESSRVSASPLWSESSKLVGRYLAPYLDNLDEVAPH